MNTNKYGALEGAAKINNTPVHRIRPPAKWCRTLRALIERPTLHRFQAECDPAIRDHCLHSTISELERKGIRIARRMVKVPGFGGERAIVAEYRLDDENRARARHLLATGAHHGEA